jgi:AcrR family transcriptional regulator
MSEKGAKMKDETLDRRVKKTKKNIRDALTELMHEKGVKDITVRELSELADINRGTFYTHYKDVFDLLEQIENEMFEEFNGAISNYTQKDIIENPGLILNQIFTFLEENSKICLSLLGKNGDISFVDRLRDLVRYKSE